ADRRPPARIGRWAQGREAPAAVPPREAALTAASPGRRRRGCRPRRAVLGPRLFIMTGVEGTLFAVGRRLDAAGVNAVAHEVLLGRCRAAVAEGEVVLIRAALVTVPADPDPQPRVRLQDRDLLIENRGVPGPDVRLVEIEVDHGGKEGPH